MTVFCTYCSASKADTPGLLPAIERYRSERIRMVFEAAAASQATFRILSAEYGLVGADHGLCWYDHRLEMYEVPGLTRLVSGQLCEAGVSHVVYFTRRVAYDLTLAPYLALIETAAATSSIGLRVIELPDAPMRTWRQIMEAAERARVSMMTDRTDGERAFGRLLALEPADGMIYFKRGEALEALHEFTLALTDYRRAERLFPMPEWKDRARAAADRVRGLM